MHESIMPNDDVMLNYIQEYRWIQSLTQVGKAGCPGFVHPPSAERYIVIIQCYAEV